MRSGRIKFHKSNLYLDPKVNFLYHYSNPYILVNFCYLHARNSDARNKQVTLKSCALSTECISQVNNTQLNNTEDLDNMYNVNDADVQCNRAQR